MFKRGAITLMLLTSLVALVILEAEAHHGGPPDVRCGGGRGGRGGRGGYRRGHRGGGGGGGRCHACEEKKKREMEQYINRHEEIHIHFDTTFDVSFKWHPLFAIYDESASTWLDCMGQDFTRKCYTIGVQECLMKPMGKDRKELVKCLESLECEQNTKGSECSYHLLQHDSCVKSCCKKCQVIE